MMNTRAVIVVNIPQHGIDSKTFTKLTRDVRAIVKMHTGYDDITTGEYEEVGDNGAY